MSRARTGAVIQTRMGSSRLPGKVMLDLGGRPVIDHVIERVKQCARLDAIVIATTCLGQDDVIVERAERNGVRWFRGSELDVLARYYHAARDNRLDVVVRITSDCPLIDPCLVDAVVERFHTSGYDLVTNAGDDPGERTYPRGLDVEVFAFPALEEAFVNATEDYQREHVTPYLYERKRVLSYRNTVDYSRYRWTLDTEEDYRLLRAIYDQCYRGKHDFYFMDVIALMERRPELARINAGVEQAGPRRPARGA